MPKISALPPMTTADAADEAPIVDTSATQTKKWTLTLLKTYLQSLTEWITASMIANRTREIPITLSADGSGGAVASINLGAPAVAFSGTPSQFARMNTILPQDWVSGTDAVIRLRLYAASGGTYNAKRYVNVDTAGDSLSTLWDVDSNVASTGHVFTANILKEIDVTIAAANLSAGCMISMAWRLDSALTGTVFLEAASLRYTADS